MFSPPVASPTSLDLTNTLPSPVVAVVPFIVAVSTDDIFAVIQEEFDAEEFIVIHGIAEWMCLQA